MGSRSPERGAKILRGARYPFAKSAQVHLTPIEPELRGPFTDRASLTAAGQQVERWRSLLMFSANSRQRGGKLCFRTLRAVV